MKKPLFLLQISQTCITYWRQYTLSSVVQEYRVLRNHWRISSWISKTCSYQPALFLTSVKRGHSNLAYLSYSGEILRASTSEWYYNLLMSFITKITCSLEQHVQYIMLMQAMCMYLRGACVHMRVHVYINIWLRQKDWPIALSPCHLILSICAFMCISRSFRMILCQSLSSYSRVFLPRPRRASTSPSAPVNKRNIYNHNIPPLYLRAGLKPCHHPTRKMVSIDTWNHLAHSIYLSNCIKLSRGWEELGSYFP